jgi:hypothetical protein
MPNWCENQVYIEATQSDIDQIISALETGRLNCLRSEPEHGQAEGAMPAWYDWRVANWGTKWDVKDVNVSTGDGWVSLSFLSAWSPPIEALEYWQAQDSKNRSYNLRYIEWGNGFCGEADSRWETHEQFNIPETAAEAESIITDSLLEEFDIIENLELMEQEIRDENAA